MPWFNGERTLEEQLLGLEVALESCGGKTVTDFGCAEGLISYEFAKRGAKVVACDTNPGCIARARTLGEGVIFSVANMNKLAQSAPGMWRSDIVLALAILHKMENPDLGLRFAAACAKELLVIRHQGGSRGYVTSKWGKATANSLIVLPSCGLIFAGEAQGPRDELVHYWRRA